MDIFSLKSSNFSGQNIEDLLPIEIVVKILSYLNKNDIMMVSMVNKRWFGIANNEIETLSIKWPKEKNQEVQNLLDRFPNLKNIELAVLITKFDYSNILPLDSFEFDGTMEFNTDMIKAKIPHKCEITRIKFNPSKEKVLEYKANQIINFEIVMPNLKDYDLVINEILSLDNVTKIRYCDVINQEDLDFVKIIKSILTRPNLKQIYFDIDMDLDLDIEEEFPKNLIVEEITLAYGSNFPFKFWKKVLDALPNIKTVNVFSSSSL